MTQKYRVKLDAFEGPLDLLLHLVKQYEIDIYDVPLVEIIDQYTLYIKTMQFLELNVASEYLVMAASLIALKSQMLLPKQDIEESDEYMEDPQEALMQRLIKYRTYKEAAEKLKDKDDQQIYTRPASLLKYSTKEQPVTQGNVSIYDMINAIGKMLERKKWTEPMDTRITRVEIPIEQRMDEIIALLKEQRDGISFERLFSYPNRSHIVITFIALLELMKDNAVYCQQQENFSTIVIYRTKNEAIQYGGL